MKAIIAFFSISKLQINTVNIVFNNKMVRSYLDDDKGQQQVVDKSSSSTVVVS